jgi:pimeloyl-ACP methyl ester carboxylesterase
MGRWIIPDLRGHGRSGWTRTYGLGEHSNDVAELARNANKIIIVGHSMGGLIGLSLATGWFGLNIVGMVVIGTIINWTKDHSDRYSALATKPIHWFDNRSDALERYLKVSGLYGLVSPTSPEAMSGIAEKKGKFRLAADNATGTIGGPWMSILLEIAECPLILVAGEYDPIVPIKHYLPLGKQTLEIPGVAHNAHVEKPAAILALLKKLGKQPIV